MMRKAHFCCLMAFGLLFVFVVGASPAAGGVVVEEVGEGSALEKAGLEPDDVLLWWERLPNPPANPEGTDGELRSPFDWEWVKVEQAPRGNVVLRGERRGEARVWTVEPGWWDGEVRPRLSTAQREEYLRGRELVTAGDVEGGAVVWRRLAQREEDELLRCWVYLRVGDAWSDKQAWKNAHSAYQEAMELAREPVAQVAVWFSIGIIYSHQGDYDQAETSFHSSLEICQKAWGRTLSFAYRISSLGKLAWHYRKLDRSLKYHQRALEIQQDLAPESLAMVSSLNGLGLIYWEQGQLILAQDHLQRALSIDEKNSGPGSPHSAMFLYNLGLVASGRGDLDLSEEYLVEALKITERMKLGGSNVARCLAGLGNLAIRRNELDRAWDYYQAAQHARGINMPGNLAIVARLRGDLALAEELSRQNLERMGARAAAWANLGLIAWARGDLGQAESHLRQALQLQRTGSPAFAATLNNLGTVAAEQDDLELAEKYFQQALKIHVDLAPGSSYVAETLQNLALVARDRGQFSIATNFFDRSLEALETQIEKLGGSQYVKGGFRSSYRDFYRDYMEILMENDLSEEAFAILERSRAQSFLAMLQERDLVFADLAVDLDQQGRALANRHGQIMRRLAFLKVPEDQDTIETLQAELTTLHQDRDDLRAKIRRESPHLANLQYPQPLDHPTTQKTLDPGTVMLSYSVGESQTDLFVVTPDRALTVRTINLGETALKEKIEDFRRMVEESRGTGTVGTLRKKSAINTGKYLYDLLIAPAQATIDTNDRILLVPDGPLHLLPFAALIHNTDESGGDWRYLIEDKPLHTVLSGTVYAEIKEARPAPTPDGTNGPLLAAFGDPYYSPSEQVDHGIRDVHARSARERCQYTATYRLPASRREVLEISSLYRNVRTHLGEGASEESLKTLDKNTRILHVAAHACLDEHLPLNSGLLLTLPEGFPEDRDNGVLQAWEIFESVRLDADLVVLSACGSGLGEDQGGEGLIGLTRAFQYAGARTVAATLWQVDDQVTAELMVRFYRHLRAGETKDAALRAAQLELIRSPVEVRGEDGQSVRLDASSPYFWAAFQLHGDWR